MNNQEPNSRIPSHIGHIDSVFIYLPELLLLMGIFTLNHLSRIGLSPLLPSIETDLGVRHSDVSLFFILISFGYCLMLIGSSFISAVITHKATIVISALGMGIILFALSLTRNISLMYFELFLLGLFTGLYLPSAIATITTKTNSKDWGKALAIHEIAPGLSYFIAPLLAEILLNIFTWRWMLVLVAFSSIIAGIIFGVKGKGGQFKGEAPKSERIMDLLHQPSLWLMIVIYSLAIGGSMGVFSLLPLYLIVEQGTDQSFANTIIAISRIPACIVTILAGWISDRIGSKGILTGILIAAGLGTALLGILKGSWMVLLLLLQPMLVASVYPPGFSILSHMGTQKSRNMVISFTISVSVLVGAGITPVIIGVMGDRGYFSLGIIILGILIIGSATLIKSIKTDPY